MNNQAQATQDDVQDGGGRTDTNQARQEEMQGIHAADGGRTDGVKHAEGLYAGKHPNRWQFDREFVSGNISVRVNRLDIPQAGIPGTKFSLELAEHSVFRVGEFTRFIRPQITASDPDDTGAGPLLVAHNGMVVARLLDEAYEYIQAELRCVEILEKAYHKSKTNALSEKEQAKRKRHTDNLAKRREEDRAHGSKNKGSSAAAPKGKR